MANKDLRSNLKVTKVLNASASTDATLWTNIYDSAKDTAIAFIFSATKATAANIKVSSIEEGDDANLSDSTTVPDIKIIGNKANVDITAANHATATFSLGVFSNKRYLRVNLAVTTPGAGNDVEVIAVSNPYILPAISPED